MASKAKATKAELKAEKKIQAAQIKARNAKIGQEVKSLETLLGKAETSAQIIAASNYQDDLLISDDDDIKLEAFTKYLVRIDKYSRVWCEIEFYRATGDTMGSLFTLAEDTPQTAFDELLVIAHRWISLVAVDALGNLENNEKSIRVKAERGSMGQRIQAFLLDHQEQNGFESYSLNHFIEARYQISEIWRAYQENKDAAEDHQALSGFSNLAIHPKMAESIKESSNPSIPAQDPAYETRDQKQYLFFEKLDSWESARDAVGKARRECDSAFDEAHNITEKWVTEWDKNHPAPARIVPGDILDLEERSDIHEMARAEVVEAESKEEIARKEYEEAKKRYQRSL